MSLMKSDRTKASTSDRIVGYAITLSTVSTEAKEPFSALAE